MKKVELCWIVCVYSKPAVFFDLGRDGFSLIHSDCKISFRWGLKSAEGTGRMSSRAEFGRYDSAGLRGGFVIRKFGKTLDDALNRAYN